MTNVSQYSAPGVYSNERDFSEYIASLGTTSIGLVGTARRGPLNVPTFVSTPEQFISIFGEPTPSQLGSHTAINFLKEGNQVWYNRVANTFKATSVLDGDVDAGDTSITLVSAAEVSIDDWIFITAEGRLSSVSKVTNKVGQTLTLATPLVSGYLDDTSVLFAGSLAAVAAESFATKYDNEDGAVTGLVFRASSPGTWANFGARSGVELIIEDGGNFSSIDPATGLSFEYEDNVPLDGILPSAPSVDSMHDLLSLPIGSIRVGQTRGVNNSQRAYRVTSFTEDTGDVTVEFSGTIGLGAEVLIRGASDPDNNGVFTVTASSAGEVTFANANGSTIADPAGVTITDLDSDATSLVFRCSDADNRVWAPVGVHTKKLRVIFQGRQVEVYDNLLSFTSENLSSASNKWDTVLQNSNYVRAEFVSMDGIQPSNSFNRVSHPNAERILLGISSQSVNTVLGSNGEDVSDADYIGVISDSGNTGLNAFRNGDFDIDLVAVPGVYSMPVLQSLKEMVESEDRRDLFFLVDPPIGLTESEVADWHNGAGFWSGLHSALVSNYGGLYYPWIKQADPFSGTDIWLPPTSFVSAVFAYSDRVANVWAAPAGVRRGRIRNALSAERVITDGAAELLHGPANGNAVNVIRTFRSDGLVVYSQRTLQRTSSALDRVNVRRLMIYITKAVAAAARTIPFEPNDPITWREFRSLVEPFLRGLAGGRALEYFRVICDESTNPPQNRNNNEINAVIELIPVKTGEKLIISYALLPSGARTLSISSVPII